MIFLIQTTTMASMGPSETPRRLTIEQIFTIRDEDTIHHSRGGLDPWDDGEEWYIDDEEWNGNDETSGSPTLENQDNLRSVRGDPTDLPVKWEHAAGDSTWVRKGLPVVKETRVVSIDEIFLTNVVEERLIGAMSVPHDLWRDVIVPLAIVKKRKKMTCLVMSGKKLRYRIRRMVEDRDLRQQRSRECVRFPTSDCINYGRLMVTVLNPTTFNKDFDSIEGGIDSLVKNDLLKIGSLEFVWTVGQRYGRGGVNYSHRLKSSYGDDTWNREPWDAVIDEIDSSSVVKIREQAIEQGLTLDQVLHIFMKLDFN